MTALIKTLQSYGFSQRRITVDRVVLALLLGLALLTAWDQTQAGRSLLFTLDSVVQIAPFFLLAIFFAGYARATGVADLIARAFSGNPVMTVVTASLVGALSPFCSCGVIPLVAMMLGSGVPLAPVMAFWIASPIMDPEMFILTAAGIGLNFAMAKAVAALSMGLLAGFAVLLLRRLGFLMNPLQESGPCGVCRPAFDINGKVQVAWKFWQQSERRGLFFSEVRENGWFLGKWLTLAFFLESLMVAYVPSDWIGALVGSDSALAIPVGVLVGIPSYLNGYAAIPLVSGLLSSGMTPGAAMAFMTAGAVSSIPAALAVYALVRRSVFGLYILLGLIGSLIAGYGYQWAGGGI